MTGWGPTGRVTKASRVNPKQQEAPRPQERDEYEDLVRSAATGDAAALNQLLMRAQETAWRNFLLRNQRSLAGSTNGFPAALVPVFWLNQRKSRSMPTPKSRTRKRPWAEASLSC